MTSSKMKYIVDISNYEMKKYFPQTRTFQIMLIVFIRNQKDVQNIWNRALHILKILRSLPSIVLV